MEVVKFKFSTLYCEEENGIASPFPISLKNCRDHSLKDYGPIFMSKQCGLMVKPIPAKKNKGRKGEVS